MSRPRSQAWAALLLLLGACGMGPRSRVPVATPAAVQASIEVGKGPVLLAVAPDGGRVYAATEGELVAIDTATNAVVARNPIDPNPVGLALTSDGGRALLATLFGVRLLVIDVVRNQALAPIELLLDLHRGGYGRVAVTPDGATAYVPNYAQQRLSIADLRRGSSESTLLDMRVRDVVVSPDGRTAYLAGCQNYCATGTIEALDTASGRIARTLTNGPQPLRVALSPDGARAYTTSTSGATLSVVDLAADQILATVPVGPTPTGLAVSRDGTRVYVASQASGTITVVDGVANAALATLKVGGEVREVVVTPDGRWLYVSVGDRVVVVPDPRLRLGSGGRE